MECTCTFFGHHDCPDSVRPKLRATLVDLIENHGVDTFYVGHQGRFDAIVRSTLRELKWEYPHIRYAVVLAYMPGKRREFDFEDCSDTILPDGIESVPPRFTISYRNRWMLKQSAFVVTYITHTWGGAAQFAEQAQKQGKCIVNIA